jgi:methylenetetrahydrofolate dehydrogenase (NADP+)/methenyltetrahydrofolate cyclohydrolase
MSSILLNGLELSHQLRNEIAHKIEQLKIDFAIQPKLSVILIGEHVASNIYVSNKQKACHQVGINCEILRFEESITEKELIQKIEMLNQDSSVHGILIQLPLPAHIHVNHIIHQIDPKKDVDGFHPYNLGLLALGHPQLRACTPYGIIQLLEAYHIPIKGIDALMIGSSRIVGLPMTLELLKKQATVTTCHTSTKNLQDKIKNNQLVIIATGHRGLIEPTSFHKDHIIVDVGIHRIHDKICGDVDYEIAKKKVAYITPVPGGVGPMTITALVQNITKAFEIKHKNKL